MRVIRLFMLIQRLIIPIGLVGWVVVIVAAAFLIVRPVKDIEKSIGGVGQSIDKGVQDIGKSLDKMIPGSGVSPQEAGARPPGPIDPGEPDPLDNAAK